MGDLIQLFTESGEKTQLIKLLREYGYGSLALYITKLNKKEYAALLHEMNAVIKDSRADITGVAAKVKEMLRGMSEEVGTLLTACTILHLAHDYHKVLTKTSAVAGIKDTDTYAEVAIKIEESAVFGDVVEFLKEYVHDNTSKT